MRHPRGAVLRLDVRAVQEARRRRAEGRLARGRRARSASIRRSSRSLARVKKPADAVYVRDQILATVARGAQRRRAGAAPGRREVVRPLCLRPDARQHRAHRAGGVRVSRRTADPTRPSNAYYRTLDSRSRPKTCRRPRASISPIAGMIVTTLSKEPLPPASRRRPRSLRSRPQWRSTSAGSCRVAPPSLPQRRARAATAPD